MPFVISHASRRVRIVPFLLALAGSAVQADTASWTSRQTAELAAENAIANFSLSNIMLTNAAEAGVTPSTAEAFETELARRLAERAASKPSSEATAKATVEVRFDTLTVQGDITRGKDGDPIPRDVFAATVRVLDDAGHQISVHVIPETQVRGDKLAVDPNRPLGIEGAAIVYRRLFGAK